MSGSPPRITCAVSKGSSRRVPKKISRNLFFCFVCPSSFWKKGPRGCKTLVDSCYSYVLFNLVGFQRHDVFNTVSYFIVDV